LIAPARYQVRAQFVLGQAQKAPVDVAVDGPLGEKLRQFCRGDPAA
jgi:hypothetical protein